MISNDAAYRETRIEITGIVKCDAPGLPALIAMESEAKAISPR